ncbi:MAG: NAD-dependent epimerase/dehydratase family protein [Parcubacteria group bacterium GW2011_GWA2_47_26]|nr:MAG: NAD-dependent epimerase/dehydratase family protein [Parcubacteria group bacterium GW2011_GWA2_47_26]
MPKIPIFEKKNVLITGGAGFLGSFLCEALLKEAKVICLDNLISGALVNIEHLLKYEDFIFIKHDINEPIDVSKWPELDRFKIKFQGLQEIYHLACPTSPKDFDKYKIDTLKVNAVGLLNLLEIAAQWKSKVLFTSSSVIYGPRPADGSFVAEDYKGVVDHLSPRACYDEGKRFSETMLATFSEVFGVDARIARIFRTYGPRAKLRIGEMIPDFVVNALENKPLEIYGDKSFRTSLCYVSDLVDGLIKLMHAETNPGPVNLGSDQDVLLVEVARKIIEMTDSSSKVVFKAPLLFMSQLPLPDIVRAKDELGWFPVVRLEDGLKAMIEYAQAHRQLLGAR